MGNYLIQLEYKFTNYIFYILFNDLSMPALESWSKKEIYVQHIVLHVSGIIALNSIDRFKWSFFYKFLSYVQKWLDYRLFLEPQLFKCIMRRSFWNYKSNTTTVVKYNYFDSFINFYWHFTINRKGKFQCFLVLQQREIPVNLKTFPNCSLQKLISH